MEYKIDTVTYLDEVSDTVFYVWKAVVGSLPSQERWRVIKYSTTDWVMKQEYACKPNGEATAEPLFKWDDRLSLTYA